MDDLFEQINSIPGEQEFLDEPVPLAIVPIAQRVRTFLAELFGAGWYAARVLQYATVQGELIYAAFGPMPNFAPGTVMQLVCERTDGSLTLAAPVDLAEDSTSDGRPGNITLLPPQAAIDDEELCLSQIIPALRSAARIVAKADISHRRKSRILSQLLHAEQHLAE